MRSRGDGGFLIGLCAVIVLAFWRPEWGGGGERGLPVDLLRPAGVFLIFFNQGLGLSREALCRGAGNWRLHLCVQSAVFLLVPLLAFLLILATVPLLPEGDLRAGFLYLAVLPTTITSAVVLTSAANGDGAGALFNTTLSNVAGVFIVPAFCLLVLLDGPAGMAPPGPVLMAVAWQILLPLLLGLLMRPVLGAWAERRQRGLRALNLGIICFLVYTAFCESLVEGVWANLPAPALAATFLLAVLFLALFSAAVWAYSRLYRLAPPARVAAFFCGSQKTLAAGLPLAASIFGGVEGGPDLGLVILPLLLYHPAQLFLAGWLLPRLRLA